MSLDFKCLLECPTCEKRTNFTLSVPSFKKVKDIEMKTHDHGVRMCSHCSQPMKVETEVTFEVMTYPHESPDIQEQIEDTEYD